MILKVEKEHKNVTVLAITTVDGITDVLNATKNTYRILDGLNRTDVSRFGILILLLCFNFLLYHILGSNLQGSFRSHHSD